MWFLSDRVRIRCPTSGCHRLLVTLVSSAAVCTSLLSPFRPCCFCGSGSSKCLFGSVGGSSSGAVFGFVSCLHAVDPNTAYQITPAPLGSLFPLAIDLLALLVSSSVALLRVLPHVSSVPVLLWCSMYVSVCMALVLPSRT